MLVAMSTYQQDRLDWLEGAIRSVQQQTFTDFVFLIIVDGSVPAATTAKLLELAAQDARLLIAQSERNIGLAACMNLAADWMLTQPDLRYFVRMDADDECLPERLYKQIHFLEHHPKVAVLGTGLSEVNEDGRKVGARVMPASHRLIVRMLPRRCTLNHPTVAIRATVFEQGYRYDGSLQNTQDYFFWIELAAAGFEFRNLREKLLNFRRVNDFYKRRGLSKSLNECKARFIAMRRLRRYSAVNTVYALFVLCLRLMPSRLVRLAYKVDRLILEKIVRH